MQSDIDEHKYDDSDDGNDTVDGENGGYKNVDNDDDNNGKDHISGIL